MTESREPSYLPHVLAVIYGIGATCLTGQWVGWWREFHEPWNPPLLMAALFWAFTTFWVVLAIAESKGEAADRARKG